MGAENGILLIAYHFPPSAAVGGRRMANFASSLRTLGWNVRALTIPDREIEQIDRGRMASVEGVPIQVAGVWPTFAHTLAAILKLRRGGTLEPRTPGTPSAAGPGGAGSEPLLRRARRYVMSFAMLPDAEKGWCVPAIVEAVRTIRRDRLDWFMTSCPPYSVHLIGLAVRKLTGARWAADFRDPWMTTGSKRLYPTSAASIAIETWIERHVMENADLVIFNVERLRNAYRDRYAHVPPEKFVFIPNAIAANTQSGQPAAPKFERFTICYTGSLYVGRSPEPVFKAVASLIRMGAVAPDAIRILLAGQCRFIDGVPTETVIRNYGLESNVELRDHVPYGEAFDLVRRSHLALLLAPNLPYQIPAKVYDYFGANVRVLAIAGEGGTADLLKETGAGRAFAGDDVDGIAAFILQELSSGGGAEHHFSLGRYSLGQVAEDLVSHLSRVSP